MSNSYKRVYIFTYIVILVSTLYSCGVATSVTSSKKKVTDTVIPVVNTSAALKAWQDECIEASPAIRSDSTQQGTAIKTINELKAIRENLEGSYYLAANIDISTESWEPLGSQSEAFTGILRGDCYTIAGLTIKASDQRYQGLFAYIGDDAEIENIGIEVSQLTASSIAGGLAGYAKGASIRNVIVSEYVPQESASNSLFSKESDPSSEIFGVSESVVAELDPEAGAYIGGVLGIADEGVELEGYNIGLSVKSAGGSSVGGLVGYSKATIRGFARNSVASENGKNIGGLVGYMVQGSLVGYYTGLLDSSAAENVGGLSGKVIDGTAEGYAAGMLNAKMSKNVGGLIGHLDGGALGGISRMWLMVNKENKRGYFGCAVGLASKQAMQYSYCDMSDGVHIGTDSASDDVRLIDDDTASVGITEVGQAIRDNMQGLENEAFAAEWVFTDNEWPKLTFARDFGVQAHDEIMKPEAMRQGRLLVSDPVQEWQDECIIRAEKEGVHPNVSGTAVSTVEDLIKIGETNSGEFHLANNIDISGFSWDPIGDESAPFLGSLYGNCYTIAGMAIDAPDASFQGLFGSIKSTGGAVKHLSIIVETIRAQSMVGALAGRAEGSNLENIFVTTYAPDDPAPDVVAKGSLSDATTGEEGAFVGAVLGMAINVPSIETKVHGVDTESTMGSMVGGVVGYVKDSAILANIQGSVMAVVGGHVGGIAGKVNESNIYGYASGPVGSETGSHVGGLVGTMSGGVLAGMTDAIVNVEFGDFAGGLVGVLISGDIQGYSLGWIVLGAENQATGLGCAIGLNATNITVATYCDISLGDHVGKVDPKGRIGVKNADTSSKGIDGPENATSATMPGLVNVTDILTWEFGGGWPRMLFSENEYISIVIPELPDSFTDKNLIPDTLVAFREQCLIDTGLTDQGTQEGIAISDSAGLQAIKEDLTATYYLVDDIGISATSWSPIEGDNAEAFTGTLHGNCWSIVGLSIDDENRLYAGLFAVLGKDASVHNLAIGIDKIHAKAIIGGLAGLADQAIVSTIVVAPMDKEMSEAHIEASGAIAMPYIISTSVGDTSGSLLGGIIGAFINGGKAENVESRFIKIESNESYVGGVIGFNQARIEGGTTVEGAISSAQMAIGGLVGLTENYVYGTSSGSILGGAYTGGLIGYIDVDDGGVAPEVIGSSSSVVTSSSSYVGGLVGEMSGGTLYGIATGPVNSTGASSSSVGGLVGSVYGGSIVGTASGDIYATNATYVGGSIGYLALADVVGNASGNVYVDKGNFVGGLAGFVKKSGIEGYALGFVSTSKENTNVYFGSALGQEASATSLATYFDNSETHVGRFDTTGVAGLADADVESTGVGGIANATKTNMLGLTEGTTKGTWKFEAGKWPLLLMPEEIEALELSVPAIPEGFSTGG